MNKIINKLQGYALSLTKNQEKAEDIVSESLEAFLTTYPHLQWDSEESLPLLHTIIKNTFLDTKRKRKEVLFTDLEYEDEHGEIATYEPAGTYGDVNYEDLYTLINSLPTKIKDAADLVLLNGYSYAEASSILGISEPALTSRLHKAKKIIKKELED